MSDASPAAPSLSSAAAQPAPFGVRHVRALARTGWLFGIVVATLLMVPAPPTAAFGPWGWAVGGAVQLASLTGWLLFRRAGRRAGVVAIAAVTWALPLDLAVMQWLAGGWDAPYSELLLLALILGSVALEGRGFAAFVALVAAAILAPALYAPADADALLRTVTQLGIWLFVAVALARLMGRIRGQARLARVDALTGLANRRAFDEATAVAPVRGALLIGDVDHFKTINDRFGHPDGDRCLVAIGRALNDAARGGDEVYRWGGDEFAVVLTDGPSPDEVEATVARVERAVAAAVHRPDGVAVRITFGWALAGAVDDTAQLVAAADAALLARKRARPAPQPLALVSSPSRA